MPIRSQHIGKKDIVKEERSEDIKRCRKGMDEATSIEGTLDDRFWIPKNVFPGDNSKADIGYANPFQDQSKACKEESSSIEWSQCHPLR